MVFQGEMNQPHKDITEKQEDKLYTSMFPNIFQSSGNKDMKPQFEQEFTYRKSRIQKVGILY